MTCYITYGEIETEYLKSKDRKLGAVIDQLGHVNRPADSDVFSSVIHQIIGQQISTKALASIWERMQSDLGEISPETLLAAGEERIQAYGTTFHKADYILEFAEKVKDGRINLEEIQKLPEEEAQKALISLKGIGSWTAEMILLFGMQKPDILSYGDLAILRGMRMVYRHRKISRDQFEKYRRRYSPYGSTASIYLWAVAGGAIPGLTDPADHKRRR